MAITSGDHLGPYVILTLIGSGGMGEVYRAKDTRLKREVALKVLPDAFLHDTDRLARFQREAELLATLNHPNIATVHGLEQADGIAAIVLELVEGETLAGLIAQGPMSLDEALPIARQIAEALEAAHEKGVIHRDLKPANIKVTSDGKVKVLDFGLAKLLESSGTASSLTMSPTLSVQATYAGVILGTAAYMSPEQARGKAVDKRTDVWALGCVLFEMLTGRQPFDVGDTISDAVAAILKTDPDWSALPADLTDEIRLLLKRCLEKDRAARISEIGTARFLMTETIARQPSDVAATTPTSVPRRRTFVAAAISALAAIVVTALTVSAIVRFSARPMQPARFAIVLPQAQPLTLGQIGRAIAVTPDGTHIVYRAGINPVQMFVRPIDQLDARPLPGITNFTDPFCSPDGRWIGFFASDGLKKVSISGGPPITLAPRTRDGVGTNAAPLGASWGPDDVIIFATADPATGLLSVPAAGGETKVLTKPDAARGEIDHAFPTVLPGGTAVLFTISSVQGPIDNGQIAVLNLKTGERKILIRGGSQAEYVDSGHLIYAAGGTLRAVRFDVKRLEVQGDPVPVLDHVSGSLVGREANFSVSRTGTLVYAPSGLSAQGPQLSLVWVNRQGKEEAINAPPRAYMYPRLSPDGTRVALDIRDQENDIWIWDLARQTLTRLTIDPGSDRSPTWTPDSRRLIFSSQRGGIAGGNLFWQLADGTGPVDRLTTSSNTQYPESISPDGTRLVFREDGAKTGRDLGVLLLDGKSRSEMLVQTPFNESNGDISPDGHWLAFQSDESGQEQVYVRPFPKVGGGRWQISPSGGSRPLWARSGRELFYLNADQLLMAVPVRTTPGFSAGNPVKVFETRYAVPQNERTYDVSADGQRFLMIKKAAAAETADATPPSMVVVINWSEELKQRVAVK